MFDQDSYQPDPRPTLAELQRNGVIGRTPKNKPAYKLRQKEGNRWADFGAIFVNSDGSLQVVVRSPFGTLRFTGFRLYYDLDGSPVHYDRETGEIISADELQARRDARRQQIAAKHDDDDLAA